MGDAHVTQEIVETLAQPTPRLRVTQAAIETLATAVPSPEARVTHAVVETLAPLASTTAARVTQAVIETLSLASTVPWEVRINGTVRSLYFQKRTLSVEETRGSRSILSGAVIDKLADPTAFRAFTDDEIELFILGVKRFGGYVTDTEEAPHSGIAGGTRTQLTAGDYSIVLDWITVTEDYGGTPIAIANSSVTSPTNLTLMAPHGYAVGDRIVIAGHTSTPNLNGSHIISAIISGNTIEIPVAVTSPGGGGTVRRGYTLRDIVSDLVSTYLSANYGISLDPLMATGPVMPAIAFTGETAAVAIERLLKAAGGNGWARRVSPVRVLEVWESGTRSAPFNLTRANTHAQVTVRKSLTQATNRVILYIGGTGQRLLTETLTVTPGGNVLHALNASYPGSLNIHDAYPNTLIVNGTVVQVIDWFTHLLPDGAGGLQPWYWDPRGANARLIYDPSLGVPSYVPVLNDQIAITYTVQYPVKIVKEDPISVQPPPIGRGPRELILTNDQITDISFGEALAQAILDEAMEEARKLSTATSTQTHYAPPGYKLTLTYPHRLVSDDWLIETVKYTLLNPVLWHYEYTFSEGTVPQRTWADYMKDWTP